MVKICRRINQKEPGVTRPQIRLYNLESSLILIFSAPLTVPTNVTLKKLLIRQPNRLTLFKPF